MIFHVERRHQTGRSFCRTKPPRLTITTERDGSNG
jgi:hypothetical protein